MERSRESKVDFADAGSWVKRPTDAQLIGNPCKGVHIRFYFTVSFMRET